MTPEKGHWHSFPCSDDIERCLTDRACDFEDRDIRLAEFVERTMKCTFTENEIEEYGGLMCRTVRIFSKIRLIS